MMIWSENVLKGLRRCKDAENEWELENDDVDEDTFHAQKEGSGR
jgi:hypothetical protein